jgi:hypothetical protein
MLIPLKIKIRHLPEVRRETRLGMKKKRNL